MPEVNIFETQDKDHLLTPAQEKKKKQEEWEHTKDYVERTAADTQESEKIIDNEIKEDEKQQKAFDDEVHNFIDDKNQWWMSYANRLAEYGNYLMSQIEYGKHPWKYICFVTDGSSISLWGNVFATKQGIVVALKDPKENVYARCMYVTRELKADLKALRIFVEQAENVVDEFHGRMAYQKEPDPVTGLKQTKSGIIIP